MKDLSFELLEFSHDDVEDRYSVQPLHKVLQNT